MIWGLLGALSLNERLPDAAPPAVGLNVTATVQVAAAATAFEVEQVVPAVAMAKGPVAAIELRVRLALPVLVSVTVCDKLVVPTGSDGKVGDAEKLTVGPVPVPLKLTVCGLPLALSVNESVPEAEPPEVGAKMTATVHVDPAVTGFEVEQVVPELAMAKGPVTVIAVKVRFALPVLVRVTVCAVLLLPDIWAGKVREEDDKLTTGVGGRLSSTPI
jgi:hypothetical protein